MMEKNRPRRTESKSHPWNQTDEEFLSVEMEKEDALNPAAGADAQDAPGRSRGLGGIPPEKRGKLSDDTDDFVEEDLDSFIEEDVSEFMQGYIEGEEPPEHRIEPEAESDSPTELPESRRKTFKHRY